MDLSWGGHLCSWTHGFSFYHRQTDSWRPECIFKCLLILSLCTYPPPPEAEVLHPDVGGVAGVWNVCSVMTLEWKQLAQSQESARCPKLFHEDMQPWCFIAFCLTMLAGAIAWFCSVLHDVRYVPDQCQKHLSLNSENPRAHHKIGTSRPKNKTNTPTQTRILWAWRVLLQKEPKNLRRPWNWRSHFGPRISGR